MAPTRTCVGCRKARPTDALFRVVRQADGRLMADRKAPGRGAWLCRGSADCLAEAVRRRAFQRAFGEAVDTVATDQLRASLKSASERAAPDVRG